MNWIGAALVLLVSAPGIETQLDAARAQYDLQAATECAATLRTTSSESGDDTQKTLLVHSLLLVAELNRMEFEWAPEVDRSARSQRGETIDNAAEEGLKLAETLPASSERARLMADLLGTMIRSKYRAKKYRKKMDAYIEEALERDPVNAMAYVTKAKPLVFADIDQGGDPESGIGLLDEALGLIPGLEAALLLKARALEDTERPEEAAQIYRDVLAVNPQCKPATHALAAFPADK